ncbi:uncharacterized protein V1518DRAFT_408095 [Limtongia smithiae]|uniref:uncharacterized protein n=1 Tax=Limtongia smithiae TaxID=1125753 RepID=UPI0034CDB3FC
MSAVDDHSTAVSATTTITTAALPAASSVAALFPEDDDLSSSSIFFGQSIDRDTLASTAHSVATATADATGLVPPYEDDEATSGWDDGRISFGAPVIPQTTQESEVSATQEHEHDVLEEHEEEHEEHEEHEDHAHLEPTLTEEDNRPRLFDSEEEEDNAPHDEPPPPARFSSDTDGGFRSSTDAPRSSISSAPSSAPRQQHLPQRYPPGQSLYNPQTYYQQEQAQSGPYYPVPQRQPGPGQHIALPQQQSKQMEYFLRTKVTGMERSGKKPPLIKFDVFTNLPRYRTTQFRDIRRTHGEFLKLFKSLCIANPECLVPTIPADTTSAGAGTDEDEYRIRAYFQKWLDRITYDPVLMRDEELMYFIEADFGYSPVTKRKSPATGLRRKAIKQLQPPPDDCQELVAFRPVSKQVFLETSAVHDKLEKVSKLRKTLGMAEIELGHKLTNLTSLEFQSGMINMWKKLGKTVMSVGDIEGAKAVAEMAALGDQLMWTSNDAYVVKETLTNRQILIRDLLAAQSTSRSRHATAARLRSSATINPLRVDEALNSLEDAKQIEASLTATYNRVTTNLIDQKHQWYERVDHDLQYSIADYVRRMIDCERRTLAVWESIRVDIRTADGSGGLSRLGRSELPPVLRQAGFGQSSQGPKGDSWSGDRKIAHGNGFLQPGMYEGNDVEDDSDGLSEIDAKNAAVMLAGSTF